MWAARVSTAFCPGLLTVARTFRCWRQNHHQRGFSRQMAADLFRIHTLFRSVSHRTEYDGRAARRDRAGGRPKLSPGVGDGV